MQRNDLSALMEKFLAEAADYLDQPGVMKALELDQLCMKLYPLVARETGDMALSNQIRDFGRGLPRKEVGELKVLLDRIRAQVETGVDLG